MDWGLLDSNAGENRFLREEVVYSSAVSLIIRFLVLYKIEECCHCDCYNFFRVFITSPSLKILY